MTPEERAGSMVNHAQPGGDHAGEFETCEGCVTDAIRAAETEAEARGYARGLRATNLEVMEDIGARRVAEEREAILKLLEDGWRTLGPLQIIEAIRARGGK